MTNIIIGNILSFVSCSAALISTRAKSYKKTLMIQSIDTTFSIFANLVLGGYSGALISICGLVRNLYCAFSKELNKIISYSILLVTLIVSVTFTLNTWYDILPILASTSYGFIILTTKDITKTKIGLIANSTLWIIYNFIIYNFVGILFKVVMIISVAHSLYTMKREVLHEDRDIG